MRSKLRRIGVLLLWEYFSCIALLPLLMLGLWLQISGTDATGWSSVGLMLVPLAAMILLIWRRPDLPEKLVLVGPEGEPPRRYHPLRVERRFIALILFAPYVGLLAVWQVLNQREPFGYAEGLLAYLFSWHVFQVLPLVFWVANRAASPTRLPPAETEILRGVWVTGVSSDTDPEGTAVVVEVRVEGVRSVETVIKSVVEHQILPKVSGGRRRWSVAVEETRVAELTQTWVHPRWWPEIDWEVEVSASDLFRGERIEFRAVEG